MATSRARAADQNAQLRDGQLRDHAIALVAAAAAVGADFWLPPQLRARAQKYFGVILSAAAMTLDAQ